METTKERIEQLKKFDTKERKSKHIEGRLYLEDLNPIEKERLRGLAVEVYDSGLATHQCYWNDRLYIAVRFGLDNFRVQKGAWNSIINNGMTGYWEAITHENFNLLEVLKQLKAPVGVLNGVRGYQALSLSLTSWATEHFRLDFAKKREYEENYEDARTTIEEIKEINPELGKFMEMVRGPRIRPMDWFEA